MLSLLVQSRSARDATAVLILATKAASAGSEVHGIHHAKASEPVVKRTLPSGGQEFLNVATQYEAGHAWSDLYWENIRH